MADELAAPVVRAMKSRNGLLWVCQRYDLVTGQEPHDNGLPSAEALVRYRKHASKVDVCLGSLYWEAVWLEGAASPLRHVFRDVAAAQGQARRRPVVTLADGSDANAQVTQEFLPVSVLPGVIDEAVPAGSRYGVVKKRTRDRVAWDLSARISDYPGRVLVVVGARTQADLTHLSEMLEDVPIQSLQVLLILPEAVGFTPTFDSPAIDLTVWRGSEVDFCETLSDIGAPTAEAMPSWSVRCGNRVLSLSPRDAERITRRFALITENDLQPPRQFAMQDLLDFLSGNFSSWSAYSLRAPVRREYRTDSGKDLSEYVRDVLAEVGAANESLRTFVMRLPSDAGAGTTTLLRCVAFDAAEAGFPTLVLRPDQIDVDRDELLAFTMTVVEASQRAGLKSPPPFLLVLDVEHESIPEIGQLAALLASHGRRAVILQAVSSQSVPRQPSQTRRAAILPILGVEAAPEEVRACAERFAELAARWRLPITVPSLADWQSYSRAMNVVTPDGSASSCSLFWIALRFFLVEGMALSDAEQALDSLGSWIEKKVKTVTDSGMRTVVHYVAGFSSFRIACPLWTVLRPVTGGAFDSAITKALRQLEGLVVWGGTSSDLEDQSLRFSHPGLAAELLRRQECRTQAERIQSLEPVITALSVGHRGDIWLAENIAASVLTPAYEERNPATDYEWRLQAFDMMPPLIREQSKTILHHWGRCLYLSVDPRAFRDVPTDVQRVRLEEAIDRLNRAIELPRRSGRDEHPSHLYNTLGTACARYARFLDGCGQDRQDIERAWDCASDAFRKSIHLAPNVEALLAFGHRLLARGRIDVEDADMDIAKQTEWVADALSCFDEAEDLLTNHPNPDPAWFTDLHREKSLALSWLDADRAQSYLRQLRASGEPAIAAYCEARIALGTTGESARVSDALRLLAEARDAGITGNSRLILLHLSLLHRHHPERYNFTLQKRLHEELEALADYAPRPIDQFRHAVLCYQTESFEEGRTRFRKLREIARREGRPQIFARDVWRDPADPTTARVTQVRITRLITEWRADGYVEDLGQDVPLRPRHFTPMPSEREPVSCVIRFEPNGPLAVPPRFEGLS